MPEEFGDNKLTQAEADELMSPLEEDLIDLFLLMRNDMLETLLDYDGPADGLVNTILGPLEEEGGPVAKDMQNVNEGGEIMKSKCDVEKTVTPKGGESEKEFIPRCIQHYIKNGNKKRDQAAAICYSVFRESKKAMIIRKATEVIKSITKKITGK